MKLLVKATFITIQALAQASYIYTRIPLDRVLLREIGNNVFHRYGTPFDSMCAFAYISLIIPESLSDSQPSGHQQA